MLATFTVTSNADDVDPSDGVTTLREAILEANANIGGDTIAFDIGGGGPQTITMGTSNLPYILDPVTVDGSSQPGFVAAPLITVDAAAVTSFEAMRVAGGGGGSTLRDFAISNASSVAILLTGGANNNLVTNVDVSGPGATGIWIGNSDNNTIRNVTATNRDKSIVLQNASGNLIEDNNLSGTGEGVRLGGTSGNNTIQNNDMSYSGVGIRDFHGTGSGNRYLGNNLSNIGWVAITIEGNDNPFVIAGNDFTNSGAVRLAEVTDVVLTSGPDFDIDVAHARAGIVIEDAHNVTIDGFDLSGVGAGGFDRGLSVFGSNFTIRNIVVRDRDFGILGHLTDSLIENIDASSNAVSPGVSGIELSAGSHRNTIQGVVSTNRIFGIRLDGDDNFIQDNTLSAATDHGIHLSNSSGNTVRNNDVRNSPRSGIELTGSSSDNLIQGNDASGSGKGIQTQSSGTGNRYVSNNLSQTNDYGLAIVNETQFVVSGNDFTDSAGGVLLANMDGLNLAPGPDFDIDVSSAGRFVFLGGLGLSNVTNSTITGFDLSSTTVAAESGAGLAIDGGSNNQISDMTMSNRAAGVWLVGTADNTIRCSTLTDNEMGVRAQAAVTGTVVVDNEISGNITGIRNFTPFSINAENNYWGAPDGPSTLGGSGDLYEGIVDADPFLTGRPGCLPLDIGSVSVGSAMTDEGSIVTLNGEVVGPENLPQFKLEIAWGDPLSPDNMQSFSLGAASLTKAVDGIEWNPTTRTFFLDHQYLDDNPSATLQDDYDISLAVISASWSSLASMPTARQSPGAGVVNGELYVVGGAPIATGNTLEVFDPTGGTWAAGPAAPTNRSAAAVEAIGDRLYVVGGCVNSDCGNNATNSLEAFDATTNSWVTGLATMPTTRFGAASAVIGGKLYVVGGGLPKFTSTSNKLEIYDPATDTWTTAADMLTARELPGAAVIAGKLYVVGGLQRTGSGVFNTSDVVEVYDPAMNSWSVLASMPTSRWSLTAETVAGKLYAIGGNDLVTPNLDVVEVYDPTTGNWTASRFMPTARALLTSAVIGEQIYVTGGLKDASSDHAGELDVFNPAAVLASATATATVQNVAPVAADHDLTTDEDSPTAAFNVLDGLTDVGTLDTHTAVPASFTTAKGVVVTIAADGSATYDPAGQFEFLAIGQWTTDSFPYTANDDDGGTDTGTVTITITGVNDAPTVADLLANISVNEDALPVVLDLSSVFQDVDEIAGGDSLTLTVEANTNPSLLTVSLLGANLTLSFAADQSGRAEVTLRATDVAGVFVEDTFTVTVLSAAQQTAIIVDDVQTLIDESSVSAGDGNALTVKLDSAIAKLEQDSVTAGVNKLNAFLLQVRAFVRRGTLTEAEGQVLTEAVNAAIDSASDGTGAALIEEAGTFSATDQSQAPITQVGELVTEVLWVALDDPNGVVTAEQIARFRDALGELNSTFNVYGLSLIESEPATAASADVHVAVASTSLCGSAADGVLGCTEGPGQVVLLTGWNWYGGEDLASVGANQYDFQSILTHELGHSMGLDHSGDASSVMHAYLSSGDAHRALTAQDMALLEAGTPDAEPAALRAAAPAAAAQQFAMVTPLDEPTGSSNTESEETSRRGARDEMFSQLARIERPQRLARRVADLTGNGFVDFEDLTVLLAHWNQHVSSAEGNLVDPFRTPVNFEDLTVLLAAWTGPGPAASPGPQQAAGSDRIHAVRQDPMNRVTTSDGVETFSRAEHRQRRGKPAAYRRLQAAAVDRAMSDEGVFPRRFRRDQRSRLYGR